MDIKEPSFDSPDGIGTTSDHHPIMPADAPVKEGTTVVLVYQGKRMTVNVTEIEEPNLRFVGSVLEFEGYQLEHGDLKHGDLIRFSRSDLRWIDVPSEPSS